MINWFSVFANSLWILGLALALATFSYANWQASVLGEKTITQLKRPGYLISFNIAVLLFCAGMAATSDTTLEIVVWSILGLMFLVQMVFALRQQRGKTTETRDHKNSTS